VVLEKYTKVVFFTTIAHRNTTVVYVWLNALILEESFHHRIASVGDGVVACWN
jgi:hypothetical protein